MKELMIFYLLISAGHLLPLTLFTMALVCDTPLPFLPNTRDDLLPTSRRAQHNRLRGLAMKDYLKEWVPVALLVQMTIFVFFSVAIDYDVELPFVPNIEVAPGDIIDLLTFAVITASIQLIPVLFLILVGVKIWRIVPFDTINRTNNRAEIVYYDAEFDTYTTIRLSRFRTVEKTVIYAKCKDDRTGEVSKFIFVRRHQAGARTECYCYYNRTLERITPAPVTVSELESVFNQFRD